MAGNSKDSKILAYKDMINQLNKTISTQTELIQSLQKTLEADRLEKENLRQQIEYLTKKLFGTSSEKREYYGAAEPPVRCGESHLSGLTEPLHFVY